MATERVILKRGVSFGRLGEVNNKNSNNNMMEVDNE